MEWLVIASAVLLGLNAWYIAEKRATAINYVAVAACGAGVLFGIFG